MPWCTTPIEAESSLGPDSHHPIISLSGIPSAVMVLRILHPILARLSVPVWSKYSNAQLRLYFLSTPFEGSSDQRARQNLKEDKQNQRREVDPPRRHQPANRCQSRLGQHPGDANHLAARRKLKPAEEVLSS